MFNWIWDSFFGWLYSIIYGAIADFFTMISGIGAALFELVWVQAALRFFYLFGWGLLLTGMVVAVFEIAVEYQSQLRFNLKRQILPFIWGLLAVNLFTTLPVALFKFCVSLQNTFVQDLLSSYIQGSFDIQELAMAAIASLNPNAAASTQGLLQLIFLIALAYCVVKVFFSNIIRGGILLTQIAVGSLYMFGVPRGYTDGFVNWCKQIAALCFMTFMQTTLLFMGLVTIRTHFLLGLGVMLAANEVPRIAQQFGLETSFRVNMMSAVHSSMMMINMTKMIKGVGKAAGGGR